jgi:hypothetical protein
MPKEPASESPIGPEDAGTPEPGQRDERYYMAERVRNEPGARLIHKCQNSVLS